MVRVRLHYELGQRAKASGANLAALAKEYGYSIRSARQSRLLAQRVDRGTFERLCRLRRKSDGLPLHWGYFHALASVSNVDRDARHAKVLKLAKQAADCNWTPDDVYAQLKGSQPRVAQPRKLKLSPSLEENLQRLADDAELWATRCRQVIEKHFDKSDGRAPKVKKTLGGKLRTSLHEWQSAGQALVTALAGN